MNESKLLLLGMQRINGSIKAENAVLITEEKLSKYGFNLIEHIVGMVTNGAAVVEKTSRLSEVLHKICRFHGIHLTVVDALYKTNNAGKREDESFIRKTVHEVIANEDCDIDNTTQKHGKNH